MNYYWKDVIDVVVEKKEQIVVAAVPYSSPMMKMNVMMILLPRFVTYFFH